MKQSEATQIVLTDLVAWARRNSINWLATGEIEERMSELQGPVYACTDKGVAAFRCAGIKNLHRRANALLRANV
jgi:hypothetical protein